MHLYVKPFILVLKRFKRYLFALIPLVFFFINDVINPVDLIPKPGSTVVLASDSSPLRAFADTNGVWRFPIEITNVSPFYLEALINYEDRHFYRHPGVNPLSLIRALYQAITAGQVISGGSTLTMQVARLRYPESRTIIGKLKEIVRALQIELHYTKEDVLTFYINHAPFGGTIEGVQAASLTYFGYGAQDLTEAQAALLAVLPQAPTRYRPDRNPLKAQTARDKVIDRLVKFNVWSEDTAVDAKQEAVSVSGLFQFQSAPLLARRLSRSSNQNIIHSTINNGWQRSAQAIAKEYVQGIGDHVSAAILVMENETGKTRTYVGSADFSDAKRFGHVDMITAIRSPGSTLKPFIYGLAIDEGLIHSESLLMNVPLRFGDYQPENFSGGFTGPVSVSQALVSSLNVPAVQVLEQLGPVPFYLALKSAGANLKLPGQDRPSLAIALGGLGANLESLVTLMASLDNKGKTISPTYRSNQQSIEGELLSEGSAWIIRSILASNTNSPMGLAIKTGTSYGFRDSWALAVANGHTIGVWVGQPDGTPLTGHYGSQTAVPLLAQIASLVIQNNPSSSKPADVIKESICWPTGQQESAEHCDIKKEAWILDQQRPNTLMTLVTSDHAYDSTKTKLRLATDTKMQVPFGCSVPYLEKTVVLWPSALQKWVSPNYQNSQRLPLFDDRCSRNLTSTALSKLEISGIREGDAIIVTEGSSREITLSAEGGQAPYYWYINGKREELSNRALTFKAEGENTYNIVLMDYHGQIDRKQLTSYF
jgi:penicillin-binding protein 1C